MQPMSILDMTPQVIAQMIAPILPKFPVERAWLFGSVARGDQRKGSDIDIIVDLVEGTRVGLGFVDLEAALASALRHTVDVSTLQRSQSTSAFLSNFDHEKVLVYERKTR